jgi:ankyrin repeat protein
LKAAGATNAIEFILWSDSIRNTALHAAAERGCTEIVKIFLETIPVARNPDLFRYILLINAQFITKLFTLLRN